MHNFRNTCTNANFSFWTCPSFRTCPSSRPISSCHYSEHDDVDLHGVVRREIAVQMAVGRQRGAVARSLMRWPFVSAKKVGEARTRSLRGIIARVSSSIVFASGCCACRSNRRCRLSDMKTKRVPALPYVYHIFAASTLHRVAWGWRWSRISS